MDWKSYERHPISARYKDLFGRVWEDFLKGVTTKSAKQRPIITYEGKILDGWQLHRACLEKGIEPTYSSLPDGEDPEDWVERHNELRRHESQEIIEARANARRVRVAAARHGGNSLQAIADVEGVSKAQVRRDLETASTGPGGPVEPLDGKSTGQDGRERPATKPKVYCQHCTRLVRTRQEPKTNCPMCASLRVIIPKETAESVSPSEVMVDKDGKEYPPQALAAIRATARLRELTQLLDDCKDLAENIGREPIGLYLDPRSIVHRLGECKSLTLSAKPAHVCGYCLGEDPKCKGCKGNGWQTKGGYATSPKGVDI